MSNHDKQPASSTNNDLWLISLANPQASPRNITASNPAYDGSPKAYLPLQTEPVDWGAPNPFGLYNMLGNVRQWTLDCWNPSPRSARGDAAPLLTGDCSERVTRGGSWNEKPSKLRAGARAWAVANDRTGNIGFRVVREMAP